MKWIFSVPKLKSWIKRIQNSVAALDARVLVTEVNTANIVTAENGDGEVVTTVTAHQLSVNGSGGILLPTGDNSSRPTTPVEGALRINTEAGLGNHVLEIYINAAWEEIALVP
jgi:curli biogenesis system outer membrane secretion channel CsgG